MRGAWTTAVVGAVVLVAVIGIADAIRGGEERPAARPSTTSEDQQPPRTGSPEERMAEQGVGGLLFVAARSGVDCRVDVFALPTLSRSSVLSGVACRIRVSSTGLVAAGLPCGAGGGRRVTAQTRAGERRLRGCAPAWRPQGGLTFVAPSGDVVELVEPCASAPLCLRVVVSQKELPSAIRDIIWLDARRLAAVVDLWEFGSFAIVVDGRFRSTRPLCCPVVKRLRSIENRLYLSTRTGQVISYDAAGRQISLSALDEAATDGRAFAASVDGEWIAGTNGAFVSVFDAAQSEFVVTLELGAVEDLDWFGS